MGDPLVASLVFCTLGLTTFEIVAAQKKRLFQCSFLQILGEICFHPHVSSRQCVRLICSELLQNPFQNLKYQKNFSRHLLRLLPGPRHGSLAFMLAAEVGFVSNIRGDYFDSPKRSYNATKCSGLRRLARQLPREPREPRARQP